MRGTGEGGMEGLSLAGRELIRSAAFVFGGARHLALAARLIRGIPRSWPVPFDPTVAEVLAHRGRAVCVLASGDPFLHGIGSLLSRHVSCEETVAVPAPSPLIFSRPRAPWPPSPPLLLPPDCRPPASPP